MSFIINPYTFGGGAFSPADIAGLLLWLKADAITGLSDGADVITWEDSSSNNIDFTQNVDAFSRPTYQTNELNSLPGVLFDGTDNYMIGSLAHTGSSLTVFMVARRVSTPGAGTHEAWAALHDTGVTNDYDGVGRFILAYEGGDGSQLVDFRNNVAMQPISHPGNGVPFLYTSKYDGTNQTPYLDGTVGLSNPSTGSFNINRAFIGARYESNNPSRYIHGYIFEFIVYDSALGDTNRQNVENYLTTKWAL